MGKVPALLDVDGADRWGQSGRRRGSLCRRTLALGCWRSGIGGLSSDSTRCSFGRCPSRLATISSSLTTCAVPLLLHLGSIPLNIPHKGLLLAPLANEQEGKDRRTDAHHDNNGQDQNLHQVVTIAIAARGRPLRAGVEHSSRTTAAPSRLQERHSGRLDGRQNQILLPQTAEVAYQYPILLDGLLGGSTHAFLGRYDDVASIAVGAVKTDVAVHVVRDGDPAVVVRHLIPEDNIEVQRAVSGAERSHLVADDVAQHVLEVGRVDEGAELLQAAGEGGGSGSSMSSTST